MSTSKGVIAVIAVTVAFFAGSVLTGVGGANSRGKGKENKVHAVLAEHERRISALEAQVNPPSEPTETPVVAEEPAGEPAGEPAAEPEGDDTLPDHISPPSTTERPDRGGRGGHGSHSGGDGDDGGGGQSGDGQAQPTNAGENPTPAPAPASGGCSYPSGDPAGAQQMGAQNLGAGQVLENFVINASSGHGINPPNVNNTVVRNGSVYAASGDNIKLGDNSRYENLYLVMAPSGGHLDALQGQASTGVTINNVTVRMASHSGVTGAILFQTLRGGGGNWNNNVTFNLNCVNLIGSGPYGHDIRIDYKDGGSINGRITNINMSGNILVSDRGGGGSCRIEVDASALPHIQNNGCEIVSI